MKKPLSFLPCWQNNLRKVVKTRLHVLSFIFLLAGLHPVSSQEDRDRKQAPSDKGRQSQGDKRNRLQGSGPPRQPGGFNRLDLLRRLLDTSPEQLRMIRDTIRRIENMTPQERDDMRKRLNKFRDMPQQSRSKMMSDFQRRQDFLERHWQGFSPDKREKEKRSFQNLSPEKRKVYINRILKVRPSSPRPPHPPREGGSRGHRNDRPSPPPR